MNTWILQLSGLMVLLFLTYYTYLQYRRRIFNTLDFVGWSLVWILLLVMDLFPQLLQPLVKPEFLFFRVLDIILVSAIAMLLVSCFYTYRKMRILEDKMRELVKAYALDKKKD
jgi:hypothetical protein